MVTGKGFLGDIGKKKPANNFMSEKTKEAASEAVPETVSEEGILQEPARLKNTEIHISVSGREKRSAKLIISLKPSFYQKLKEQAEKDGRSMGNLLESLAMEYVKNREAEEAAKAEKISE